MVSCPTGALTNRKVLNTELGEGAPLTVQELRGLEVFSDVSGTFLSLNSNAVHKRLYRAGDIVCREGDYGSTAFYIVSGKADVFLSGPMGHVTTKTGTKGLLRKLKAAISTSAQNRREEAPERAFIPIDAPVDLSLIHI